MLSEESTVTGVRTSVNHKDWQQEQQKLLLCMNYRWLYGAIERDAWTCLDFPWFPWKMVYLILKSGICSLSSVPFLVSSVFSEATKKHPWSLLGFQTVISKHHIIGNFLTVKLQAIADNRVLMHFCSAVSTARSMCKCFLVTPQAICSDLSLLRSDP